jgi:hypothetical protein
VVNNGVEVRDGDESLPYVTDPLTGYQCSKRDADILVLAAKGATHFMPDGEEVRLYR